MWLSKCFKTLLQQWHFAQHLAKLIFSKSVMIYQCHIFKYLSKIHFWGLKLLLDGTHSSKGIHCKALQVLNSHVWNVLENLAAHWRTDSRSPSYDFNNLHPHTTYLAHFCHTCHRSEFYFHKTIVFCPFKVLIIELHLRSFVVHFLLNTVIYSCNYLYVLLPLLLAKGHHITD